ncbi:MAG: FAD binding domain-containing protein, partial [Rhodospirillales bacterium]|nr:FAD binding domain-containing protein [Rhodospirillales bacterium]
MNYLRRLPKFKFVSPDSMTELCTLVEQATPGEAMLFAGGTDAVLQLRRREMTPAQVIGMKRIAGLDFIRGEEDGGLSIGAMTNLQSLITSPIVQARHGVLGETAVQIGGLELRNVATLGGNIAGALPCADMPAPMMILDARVKLTSKAGERWVGLD